MIFNLVKSFAIQSKFRLPISTSCLRYDSIFALSSGSGKCGVSVIRLSGPDTKVALCKMMKIQNPPRPRKAILSNLYNQNDIMLDKALVLWFPSPHSFTGEDVCEFHVHGGSAVIASVFEAVGSIDGFRPAEPGDYTKRAFFNEKLDLTEVEGLGDLIHSETEAQRRQALRQMEGGLRNIYDSWKNNLLKSLSHLEAYIDFGEDQNIHENFVADASKAVAEMIEVVQQHLNDKRRGERLRDGVNLAIMGEPNVGKSSLLNEISQRPAAIVSEIPGTTRDIIETTLDIGGYPVLISDTAGIRETSNPIEKEGVIRAKNKAKNADIILVMCQVDSNKIENIQSEVINMIETLKTDSDDDMNASDENIVVLINKVDLLTEHEMTQLTELSSNIKWKTCLVSCKNKEGLTSFLENISVKLKELCEGNLEVLSPSITQQRHRFHATKCLEYLESSAEYLERDIVIGAEYLRFALTEIGKITGKIGVEDILDVIFKDFCIGK